MRIVQFPYNYILIMINAFKMSIHYMTLKKKYYYSFYYFQKSFLLIIKIQWLVMLKIIFRKQGCSRIRNMCNIYDMYVERCWFYWRLHFNFNICTIHIREALSTYLLITLVLILNNKWSPNTIYTWINAKEFLIFK